MTTATIRISTPFPEGAGTATAPKAKAGTAPSTPWYRRVFDIFVEARMAQAEREISRLHRLSDWGSYRHLTPPELEAASLRASAQDELPFTRA
jgi:hypothetical protein